VSALNDHFFDGQHREVWRRLVPAGLTGAETDFIEQVAGLAPGDQVLDLMCGFGRHSLELARRGYRVTAVDNSAPYVDEVRTAAQAEQLPIEAECKSVLEWHPRQSYAAVILMGNSFTFFDVEGTRRLFALVAAALKPGARFLVNTWMIGEIAYRHFREREWHEVEGYKYLISHRFFQQPARIESEHVLVTESGIVETTRAIDYIYTINELETLLAETGLRFEAIYSTPRRRPFQLGDTQAYISAVKL